MPSREETSQHPQNAQETDAHPQHPKDILVVLVEHQETRGFIWWVVHPYGSMLLIKNK